MPIDDFDAKRAEDKGMELTRHIINLLLNSGFIATRDFADELVASG